MKFLQELHREFNDKKINAFEEDDGTDKKTDEVEQKVIAKADEFKVILGADEQVQLINRNKDVLVSMPLVIWQQLTRS
jgi:hypothetical protein